MATTPPSTTFAIATSPPSPSTAAIPLSFGGDRDPPPFASGAAARPASARDVRRREGAEAVRALAHAAATRRTAPESGPRVVQTRAGSGSPRARRANVAVVAPDATRARRERERGERRRGKPRPSPIVPAEPLKRLSPEPSPQLEPSTEPETGAQTPAATLVSLEDPDAKTARAVHAGTETALAGTASITSGNGFVDAIVSPSAPRTPSFSPRPARVDVGSAVVSESVAASMMPRPPPVPRTSSPPLLRRRDPSWRVRR